MCFSFFISFVFHIDEHKERILSVFCMSNPTTAKLFLYTQNKKKIVIQFNFSFFTWLLFSFSLSLFPDQVLCVFSSSFFFLLSAERQVAHMTFTHITPHSGTFVSARVLLPPDFFVSVFNAPPAQLPIITICLTENN